MHWLGDTTSIRPLATRSQSSSPTTGAQDNSSPTSVDRPTQTYIKLTKGTSCRLVVLGDELLGTSCRGMNCLWIFTVRWKTGKGKKDLVITSIDLQGPCGRLFYGLGWTRPTLWAPLTKPKRHTASITEASAPTYIMLQVTAKIALSMVISAWAPSIKFCFTN